MKDLSKIAKTYITLVCAAGLLSFTYGLFHFDSKDLLRFFVYALIALLGSSLKVTLPGVRGTMSVNYVFMLMGILTLSLGETMAMSVGAALVQSVWHAKERPKKVHLIFNMAILSLAILAASFVYNAGFLRSLCPNDAVRLAISSVAYFLANTLTVALVIALTERKKLTAVWSDCYFWSFPYYLIGATLAGGVHLLTGRLGWQVTLIVFPVIYLIFRSYRLYLGQLEHEKLHAERVAALHLRTIEALALAIEAKDLTTHDHLRRVQVYAVEIGKELGLSDVELQALQAASILHDIGKLAVPDYIISKPGKLTPEEFEKMKIHPVVGGEILERVDFPYPVVPIVRCHHERWDGSGYPDGLKGEQIPIGARILAAVDCLDALASDRQYRRALPLDDAMAKLVNEAGTNYDPRVIEILHRRYLELEKMAVSTAKTSPGQVLSTNLVVERGLAPAAGFEQSASTSGDFLSSIAAARQEVQTLFELTQDLGSSLSLEETLSVVATRLKTLIPFDCIAIYVRQGERMVPKYVNGENSRLFASLEVPVGQGLCGWVAENQKPIINGNPSVEPGYLNDKSKFSTLRSALAVPLTGVNNMSGVLALYRAEKDAFTKDHLRVLLAINSKISIAVENAMTYQQAQRKATTDALTELPNASSLFIHLDSELARSRRVNAPVAVLVCDLDGFKQVNDRFGHLAGNEVLRMVAGALKENCREYDYVARMGGDEFVMVFPGAQEGGLRGRIDIINREVQRVGRRVCGEDILSISIGEAYCPGDGADAESLLAKADKDMYRVKQSAKARATPMGEPLIALAGRVAC